ncbi:hypothetical protein [Bradyrhizobium sp. Ash2021]|uniref:TlpA family protein disulfide reductase n=1 Tax=Bradyrhizobium sp. Ash2021 TaxID=2954771 RepID=UPI0028152378|nr:hypothetical protein [Bradyrhizobium sp. Ash2021]WMT72060.1 hypothetical protein NL528_28865 [Bradyrhizobium sp. Ash2021]
MAMVAIEVGDNDIAAHRFLEKLPVDFSILRVRDRTVARAWRGDALPEPSVLDKSLKSQYCVQGTLDWDDLEISYLIAAWSLELTGFAGSAPHTTNENLAETRKE